MTKLIKRGDYDMINIPQPYESLQDEYDNYRAQLDQTKKILTHLMYLKQLPIPPKQACFRERMFHEQREKYTQEIIKLNQLKQCLNQKALVK